MDHLCYFCLCLLCFHARLFVDALWSPAGKVLTSWLSFVMSNCTLGPVVNILAIISNANILKQIREYKYTTSKVSVVRYYFRFMSFLTKERKNKKEEKMIRLEPRLV